MKAPSVRIPLVFRGKAEEPPGIVAVARVDPKTKNITKRLNPGEIAIIDHSDLDRVSAEELIRRKVAAVVNVSVSITGRYPNLGPKLLLDAGIPVIDGVGATRSSGSPTAPWSGLTRRPSTSAIRSWPRARR